MAAKKTRVIKEKPLLRLDLGSGPRPKEGFDGVDIVPGVSKYCHDLSSPRAWPFKSNSVDELHSSHFIEHIDAVYHLHMDGYPGGRIDALYWFLEEAYRVAKPGAKFTIQWPALQNPRAFQDPTHRRFIPAEQTMYWSVDGRKSLGQSHLGVKCNWVGNCLPLFTAETETEEDKAMALRADSSDEKRVWLEKKSADLQRRYRETWGFSQDFLGTFKAVK